MTNAYLKTIIHKKINIFIDLKTKRTLSIFQIIVGCITTLFHLESANRVFVSKHLNFNWGVVWSLLSQLILVTGFAILLASGLRGTGRDFEYFIFLILFWFGFQQVVSKTIRMNFPLILWHKKNINILIVSLSIGFSQISALYLRFLICLFVMTFLGYKIQHFHVFSGFILISLFGFLYGILLTYLFKENEFLIELNSFFLTAMFFLSSIIVPIHGLPENIRNILLFNPLVHLFEWIKVPTTQIYYDYIQIEYFLNFIYVFLILSPIFLMLKQDRIHKNF